MKLGLLRSVILVLTWTVFESRTLGGPILFCLVARNRVQLERMIKDTTAAFFAHGVRWKAGDYVSCKSMVMAFCSHDDCISFSDEVEKFTVPRVTPIKTLGSVIDQHGRTDGALESQLSRAKGSCFAASDYVLV